MDNAGVGAPFLLHVQHEQGDRKGKPNADKKPENQKYKIEIVWAHFLLGPTQQMVNPFQAKNDAGRGAEGAENDGVPGGGKLSVLASANPTIPV